MIKTGLLFGSFNPIHIGHIAIAGYMQQFEGLDEIWFIVSPQNPLKNAGQLASPTARLQMVRLAVEEYPAFKASDIEFGMPLPSFTLNTMQKLVEEYPERDYHIIIGTDNVDSLRKWKGSNTLLREHKFLVYPRIRPENSEPGNYASNLETLIQRKGFGNKFFISENLQMDLFSKVRLVDAPKIEVSSSFIRESLNKGKDMRAFVPPKAYDYLIKNKLWK